MTRGYPHHKQDNKIISTVYALCGPENEIRYVGITAKPLAKRLREHILWARSWHRSYRDSWIRSLAADPTIIEIEQTADRSREKYWIRFYWDAGCKLTNLTAGGDGAALGRNFTPEHRRNISKQLKSRPKSKEHRERLSKAKTGTTHSEETRKKIGNLTRGRIHKEETKAKIAASHIGLTHTDESKRKLSETRKRLMAEGKIVSPTQGKHHSEETRKKISNAIKRTAAIKRSLRAEAQSPVVQGLLFHLERLPE